MTISHRVSHYFRKGRNYLSNKENWPYIGFFAIVFVVLLINAFHESYPDEFDNILGGWYLLRGIPIYSGFFTHHGPTAYFLSSLIEIFGGRSFVHYRVIFAVIILAYHFSIYHYLRSQFGRNRSFFYLIFIGVISLAGNYYWLHMLLADTLSCYFFAPVVAILFLRSYYRLAVTQRDLIIISILVGLTCLSSLTFIYVAITIYTYSLYLYLTSNKLRLFSRSLIRPLIIFAVPYVLFLLYLVVTGSLSEYFYQAFTFNQRYYIYNYPRPSGSTTINPVRFAVVIADAFYNNFFTLLQQVGTLNIGFPMNITMAVGSMSLIIYLVTKRKFSLALVFLICIVYANSRSNPLVSKETDYQAAVYIMLSFFAISFLLTRLFNDEDKEIVYGRRVVHTVLLILVGFYSLFALGFLGQKFVNRTYEKYMGTAALIYDRPELAPIINKIVAPNEPVWVGPFEFKELFYLNGKPATHYQIFLPGMGQSPEIRPRFTQEFEVSKPKVIYFQKNFFILGRSPEMYGQFFIDYLSEHYVTLQNYKKDGVSYKSSVPVSERIDLETRLYLRKENADEEIRKLLDNQLIHQVGK